MTELFTELINNPWIQAYGLLELVRNVLGLIIYLPFEGMEWDTVTKTWFPTTKWVKANTIKQSKIFKSIRECGEWMFGDSDPRHQKHEDEGVSGYKSNYPDHDKYQIIMILVRDFPTLYPSTVRNEVCFIFSKLFYLLTK